MTTTELPTTIRVTSFPPTMTTDAIHLPTIYTSSKKPRRKHRKNKHKTTTPKPIENFYSNENFIEDESFQDKTSASDPEVEYEARYYDGTLPPTQRVRDDGTDDEGKTIIRKRKVRVEPTLKQWFDYRHEKERDMNSFEEDDDYFDIYDDYSEDVFIKKAKKNIILNNMMQNAERDETYSKKAGFLEIEENSDRENSDDSNSKIVENSDVKNENDNEQVNSEDTNSQTAETSDDKDAEFADSESQFTDKTDNNNKRVLSRFPRYTPYKRRESIRKEKIRRMKQIWKERAEAANPRLLAEKLSKHKITRSIKIKPRLRQRHIEVRETKKLVKKTRKQRRKATRTQTTSQPKTLTTQPKKRRKTEKKRKTTPTPKESEPKSDEASGSDSDVEPTKNKPSSKKKRNKFISFNSHNKKDVSRRHTEKYLRTE